MLILLRPVSSCRRVIPSLNFNGEISCRELARKPCGFGAIIRCDLRTLSLPRDSTRDNLCVRDVSPCGKGNSRSTKLLGGLSYEKILRYNNSPPYVTARWPPQQIPPLNFLELTTLSLLKRLAPNWVRS